MVNAGLEQLFSTTPVPNLQTALYTLSIRAPIIPIIPVSTYTFPISPANLRRDFTAMTNFYDVQGSAVHSGVQRVVDLYGNAPPIWTIQGTTGWQYHATDGGQLTGLESILAIIELLDNFAEINAIAAGANIAPCTLEFYDYFSDQYWQVVPIGPQTISQNERRPLLFEYNLRFAGVQDLSLGQFSGLVDSLLSVVASTAEQAISDLTSNISLSLGSYVSITPSAGITLNL